MEPEKTTPPPAQPWQGVVYSYASAGAARLAAAHLAEAIAAIHRPVASRNEWDLCRLAAVGAGDGMHLPPGLGFALVAAATAAIGARFAPLTRLSAAVRASSRLVGQPTLSIELLLTGAESEGLPAIPAGQGLVLVTQSCSSSAVPDGYAVIQPDWNEKTHRTHVRWVARRRCDLPDGVGWGPVTTWPIPQRTLYHNWPKMQWGVRVLNGTREILPSAV
jgi:hypothetical protein